VTSGEFIAGTHTPNTKEGVDAFVRSVIDGERKRQYRNARRKEGHYEDDLKAAVIAIDSIDRASDQLTESTHTGHRLSSLIVNAGDLVRDALDGEGSVPATIVRLEMLRDEAAYKSAQIADGVVALDTVIKNMTEGEPET